MADDVVTWQLTCLCDQLAAKQWTGIFNRHSPDVGAAVSVLKCKLHIHASVDLKKWQLCIAEPFCHILINVCMQDSSATW